MTDEERMAALAARVAEALGLFPSYLPSQSPIGSVYTNPFGDFLDVTSATGLFLWLYGETCGLHLRWDPQGRFHAHRWLMPHDGVTLSGRAKERLRRADAATDGMLSLGLRNTGDDALLAWLTPAP